MSALFKLLLALLVLAATAAASAAPDDVNSEHESFFDFSVTDLAGVTVPLRRFAAKRAVLVVNVASACGYTDQNYRELQALYAKYEARGLEILAFPCNQFGAQEPGTPEQIRSFVHDTYAVTFPVFAKVDVNGARAHPLFAFLKRKLSGFITADIKWNFTKFLVVDGEPFKRYGTSTSPFDLENDIVQAIASEPSSSGDERQEL
ncbi:hypothetical protein PybrP1_007701 [[Pythium] brassicae (nom. inval.)]|nr:hypothetical protein PybrP1_007701 [[Pythium] brassicae (nom. inval.)]